MGVHHFERDTPQDGCIATKAALISGIQPQNSPKHPRGHGNRLRGFSNEPLKRRLNSGMWKLFTWHFPGIWFLRLLLLEFRVLEGSQKSDFGQGSNDQSYLARHALRDVTTCCIAVDLLRLCMVLPDVSQCCPISHDCFAILRLDLLWSCVSLSAISRLSL